jgi:hypothetical protein
MGVEGTYGYELECYLRDLPATVCCAEYRTEPRVSSSTRTLAIEKGHTGWYFISQKKDIYQIYTHTYIYICI